MAEIVHQAGHAAILMEDVPAGGPDEDMVQKFERILETQPPDAIFVYWPPRAKMQTTFDELLLLRKRWETHRVPPIIVFHFKSVARVTPRAFQILEAGGRSRYLDAVRRLSLSPVPWTTPNELLRKVAVVAQWEF